MGLGAEARDLAKQLKLIKGELRFEKQVFERCRLRVRALGATEQAALARDLIALMLRLRRLKKPSTAIAVLQLLMLTREVTKPRAAPADGFDLR